MVALQGHLPLTNEQATSGLQPAATAVLQVVVLNLHVLCVYASVCACVNLHVLCVHVSVCVCACVYVGVCTCVYVCLYVLLHERPHQQPTTNHQPRTAVNKNRCKRSTGELYYCCSSEGLYVLILLNKYL